MKDEKKLLVIKTVRISDELNKHVALAAEKLGSAEQDVIRLALRIGLTHLESIKYDIAKAVLGESGKLKK